MTRIPRAVLWLAAAVALVACGDNATEPGNPTLGTATVQITGSLSHSFSGGLAVAGLAEASGLYVSALQDDAGAVDLGIIREGAGRGPAPMRSVSPTPPPGPRSTSPMVARICSSIR